MKARHIKSNFVTELVNAEKRQLTMAEAVNRYLMKVEAGEVDPATQGTRIVQDIATHFKITPSVVTAAIEQQGSKRVQAAHTRIARVRGALEGAIGI
jgi:hypothetical protein